MMQVCPRRAVLLGAGLTTLLAACGGDPPKDAGGPTTGAPPTTDPTAAPVPTGAEPPDGALVAVEEVAVGSGVVVDDILVVQPAKGTFRAYDAECPHQGIMVDPPDSSGIITCPGHLSRFRAADGSRVNGPAPRGLKKINIKVLNGYVVAA